MCNFIMPARQNIYPFCALDRINFRLFVSNEWFAVVASSRLGYKLLYFSCLVNCNDESACVQ